MTLLLYFAIIVLVIFADLFTKFLVKGSELLMSGGVIELIPGVFRFRYVENPGAAMGSFSNNRWVFMIFSTVAIIALIIFLVIKYKTLNRLLGVSLALITGGGVGNMYERLFNQNAQGKYVVTDFFDFYLFDFWKWVFNVADVAVCVGAGLMMLYLILDLIADFRAHKHPERYDELVALDALDEDTDDVLELLALDGAGEAGGEGFGAEEDDEDSFMEDDEVDLDALEELYLDDGEGFDETFDGEDDSDMTEDDGDGEDDPFAV